jgi:hypothetical protein
LKMCSFKLFIVSHALSIAASRLSKTRRAFRTSSTMCTYFWQRCQKFCSRTVALNKEASACARCPFCLLYKLSTYSVHRGWMTTCSKAFFTSSIQLIMRNWQANRVSAGTIKDFLGEFSRNSAIVTWWFRM